MSDPSYSAAFLAQIPITLSHEGGSRITDDPDDSGGLTKWGISQYAYPSLDIRDLTEDQAIEIYHRDYWAKYNLDLLPALIAAKVFDLGVNIGTVTAIKFMQEGCGDLGNPIVPDGVIGPHTVSAVMTCDPSALRKCICVRACAHYRAIVAANPSQSKYLNGWLARANA